MDVGGAEAGQAGNEQLGEEHQPTSIHALYHHLHPMHGVNNSGECLLPPRSCLCGTVKVLQTTVRSSNYEMELLYLNNDGSCMACFAWVSLRMQGGHLQHWCWQFDAEQKSFHKGSNFPPVSIFSTCFSSHSKFSALRQQFHGSAPKSSRPCRFSSSHTGDIFRQHHLLHFISKLELRVQSYLEGEAHFHCSVQGGG